ncbi:hypothetical protein ABT010_01735 [Streptomyces sp. NPDC002668]|uniref:hypothetical protein n=1 Tax=Streptomyces sp. NPDC002668 TaxID=3154422 RepID=UPI00332A14D5
MVNAVALLEHEVRRSGADGGIEPQAVGMTKPAPVPMHMHVDPFPVLEALVRQVLRVGVIALLLTVCAMGLLVGVLALGTRRVRRRRRGSEEECEGLESFTWKESE